MHTEGNERNQSLVLFKIAYKMRTPGPNSIYCQLHRSTWFQITRWKTSHGAGVHTKIKCTI